MNASLVDTVMQLYSFDEALKLSRQHNVFYDSFIRVHVKNNSSFKNRLALIRTSKINHSIRNHLILSMNNGSD